MNWEFVASSLLLIVIPGPGVILTLAVALSRGFRMGVVAAFGCTLGILPHATAAVFGLAALLHASATAFQIVKLAGVAWLLWMAWSILRDDGVLKVDERLRPVSTWMLVRDGILLNLLNPKLSVFFLAFLPQFLSFGTEGGESVMLVLAGLFILMTFVVFIIYAAFAAGLRLHILGKEGLLRRCQRIFALCFVALALRLAVTDR